MKKLIVEILIGLVSYFTIVGCSESFYEANKSQFILEVDSFFYFNEHTSRSLEQDKATISSLIHKLKRQTDLAEKIHKFKHQFGVPYWNEFVLIEEARKTNIFIPVINDKKEEVSTIWIFELENNKFRNKIIERDWTSYYPGHTWMFDYFTTYVLSKKPKSKVHFKTNTRMASVECVETFVEIEYQNNIITVPTGTYCWAVYDADESSDSGFENENGDNLPNVGDESGGGSGSNTPDTSSQNGYSNDYPQINNHSSSIQLTEASMEQLEHAFSTLTSDCAFNTLDSKLSERNVFSNLEIQNSSPSDTGAMFSKINGNRSVKLSPDLNWDAASVFHEFFHIYQDVYSTEKPHNNPGMAEFEVALFLDLYFYLNQNLYTDSNFYTHNTWTTDARNDSIDQQYRVWLNTLTSNGTQFPQSISTDDFCFYSSLFGQYCNKYKNNGYIFGDPNYGTDLIAKICKEIDDNCY